MEKRCILRQSWSTFLSSHSAPSPFLGTKMLRFVRHFSTKHLSLGPRRTFMQFSYPHVEIAFFLVQGFCGGLCFGIAFFLKFSSPAFFLTYRGLFKHLPAGLACSARPAFLFFESSNFPLLGGLSAPPVPDRAWLSVPFRGNKNSPSEHIFPPVAVPVLRCRFTYFLIPSFFVGYPQHL